MRIIPFLLLVLLAGHSSSAFGQAGRPNEGQPVDIIMGERTITAVINDSSAGSNFLEMLPLPLTMARLYDREYYTALPKTLAVSEPPVKDYQIGDIAYWPDWNYIGILFSKTRPLSSPVIILGRVTSGLEIFEDMGSEIDLIFQARP